MEMTSNKPSSSTTPVRWDGHTHTEFCPHGDGAPLEQYLQRAIVIGLDRYSVTEHPPLPGEWLADSAVQAQLAMIGPHLAGYFDMVHQCRERFAQSIDIRCGLELDYLHGRESFTLDLLHQFGDQVEEAIVSVHFLPGRGGNRCVDYSSDDILEGLLYYHGSMDALLNLYYDHVELAISYAGTLPIPTRIGHINLIEKFRHTLPSMDPALLRERQERLLPRLAATQVGVDVNMAGLRRDTCAKPYVDSWFVEACGRQGTACVFGSDAHSPRDVGAGLDTFLSWYQQ